MKTSAHTVLFTLSNKAFQRARTKSIHISSHSAAGQHFPDILSRENTQCPLLDSIISSFTNDEGQTDKKKTEESVKETVNVLKERR